jgi:hypothetical protein
MCGSREVTHPPTQGQTPTSGEVSPTAKLRVKWSPMAKLRVKRSLRHNLGVKRSPEPHLLLNPSPRISVLAPVNYHFFKVTKLIAASSVRMALELTSNSPESTATLEPTPTPNLTRRLQIRFTDNDGNEFDLENHHFKYLQLNELNFVATKLQEALQANKKAKPFVAKFTKVSNRDPKHKSPAGDFDLLHSFCYGGSEENVSLSLSKRLGEEFSRKLKNSLLKVRPQVYVDIINYTSIDEFNSEPIRSDVDGYCEVCADNFTTAITGKLEYSVSKAYTQKNFREALSQDTRKD